MSKKLTELQLVVEVALPQEAHLAFVRRLGDLSTNDEVPIASVTVGAGAAVDVRVALPYPEEGQTAAAWIDPLLEKLWAAADAASDEVR